MSITVPLNAAALPLVRRWPRCPRRYAAPYAKRCGATSLTLAGQSRRKRGTGSLVAGARPGTQKTRLFGKRSLPPFPFEERCCPLPSYKRRSIELLHPPPQRPTYQEADRRYCLAVSEWTSGESECRLPSLPAT